VRALHRTIALEQGIVGKRLDTEHAHVVLV
jgi:hypothetical protein